MQNNLSASTKVLFVSDVHLGGFSFEKNQQIEADLIQLIDYAEEHQFKIAVLGDLFDYWMEYENYFPAVGKNVLERFAAFNKKNDSLYITGNHDNWTRGYFETVGFDVEQDYRILQIGTKKVLLAHGDAIGEDLNNLKRPLLHRFLRNKNFIKWYQWVLVNPETGNRVMRQYSRFTNFMASGKTNPVPLDNWSKKILQKKDINVVICGHDHVPRVHSFNDGIYMNTGTFYAHKTLVIYNNNRFRLVCWNRDKDELTPFHPKR